MTNKKYQEEWCLLQNQFESYEKHALYIKLISVVLLFIAHTHNISAPAMLLILVVLWLQDAIWKTFQSRLEPRLLQIEKNIKEKTDADEFQFNSEYQKFETHGLAKIKEYAKQALRPTVAFPHIILIVVLVGCYIV